MVAPVVKPSTTPSSPVIPPRSERRRAEGRLGRALVGATALFGRLPFGVRGRIGFILGYIAGAIPSRERTVARLQLQSFLPEVPAAATTRRAFGNAGRTLLESVNLKPLLVPPYPSIRCDNWEQLETLLHGSRPVVVLTGHTGNWDLLAAYAIARGARIATIGREARNGAMQDLLRSIRDGYGIETIWRSDKAGIKKLINHLKERRVVAALIDQDTRVESAHIPFFGESAKTPSSLIALGKKYDACFISSFLFRTSSSTFEVFAEPFDDSLSETELLTQYNQRLEQLVRRFPEQWVWFHKRWRTTPDGHTKSSREYIAWLREKISRGVSAATTLLICLVLSGCSFGPNDLHRAEALTKEGRYDEAIAAYRAHMESRLEVSDRPEWENPYFYLILIGDVQLSRGDANSALTIYEEAESKLLTCEDPEAKKFHETLLSDRYRALATWYADHGQEDKALEVLRRFRERDSLIFDAMLDRIARKLTEKEMRAGTPTAAPGK